MGIVTLLIGLLSFALGVACTSLYWTTKLIEKGAEYEDRLTFVRAEIIEAEERGRWRAREDMDYAFSKASPPDVQPDLLHNLTQPDLQPPDELMLAYGVSRVEDLPAPLRAIWEKNCDGGDS